MELDEVLQRVLWRYGLYLAIGALIPVLLGMVIAHNQAPSYVSTARVQLTASTPDTAAAADAVVSQAAAAVTTTGAVEQALQDARVTRDVSSFLKNDVSVTGLGTSSTVDISVTDHDAYAAQRIAAALATHLVDSTNELRLGGLPGVLTSIDQQLTSLAAKRAPLASVAQSHPTDAVAQNRLAGMDRLISDLSADRDRLALDAAASAHATVLNQPAVADKPQPSRTPQILVLVGVCALVIGLLVVALIEAVKPHVSGGSRISRLLKTHSLGTVLASRRGLKLEVELTRRVRMAAQRAGGSQLVVAPIGRVRYVTHLVTALETQLVQSHPLTDAVPAAGPARVATAADGNPMTGPETEPQTVPDADSQEPNIVLVDLVEASVRGSEPEGSTGAGSGAEAASALPRLAPLEISVVAPHFGNGTDAYSPARHVGASGAGATAVITGSEESNGTVSTGVLTVRSLDQLGPLEDPGGVTVIIASPPAAPRADLDRVHDLLQISGWPLLGVITVAPNRRFWGRR